MNLVETFLGVSQDEDRYTIFNDWCKSEGVIMPKLEYPAVFEDGLIGARVT